MANKRIFLESRSGSTFYTLVGLSSQLKDYRLSFLINKLPGFDLVRFEDLMVSVPEAGDSVAFSVYTCSDEENYNSYTLLSNRSSDHFLIPAFRQTDYLLLIEGPFKKQQMDRLLKTLRTIPEILLAAEIKPESIKQFESLVSDLELHVMKNIKKVTHIP
ncbi:MAG: IPExxxVDY family protein [Bacteroidales bacterium]|nr:IPExxxVDY family protein [Bacteroidales bacterium]